MRWLMALGCGVGVSLSAGVADGVDDGVALGSGVGVATGPAGVAAGVAGAGGGVGLGVGPGEPPPAEALQAPGLDGFWPSRTKSVDSPHLMGLTSGGRSNCRAGAPSIRCASSMKRFQIGPVLAELKVSGDIGEPSALPTQTPAARSRA